MRITEQYQILNHPGHGRRETIDLNNDGIADWYEPSIFPIGEKNKEEIGKQMNGPYPFCFSGKDLDEKFSLFQIEGPQGFGYYNFKDLFSKIDADKGIVDRFVNAEYRGDAAKGKASLSLTIDRFNISF